MTRKPSRWHGLLPVHKTAGPTSHDVVDMARRALAERRIGHTGTLDPMAEGLLLLCVGTATRLQQYLMRWEKSYRGRIRLGRSTTTYDVEGDPADPSADPPPLDRTQLDRLEERFTGVISQIPPPYSAKKVAGKRLYELARSGRQTEVEPKTVTAHSLHLDLIEADLLGVEVTTSTGFYVRTLANDIGCTVGCGAHLESLCRVAIGPYTAAAAFPQRELELASKPEEIVTSSPWIELDDARLPLPDVSLNATAGERFCKGQDAIVFRTGTEPLTSGMEIAVRGPLGELLGIGLVQAVLARGRTISLRPLVVLQRRLPEGQEQPDGKG